MNRSHISIIKSFTKLICFVLLFINTCAVQAQKPTCNFNDTNRYFYHWGFSAENIEFEFELENLTDATITNDISEYTIDWGDESATETVVTKKFPLKHIYKTKGQFDLVITIIYLEQEYTYEYKVYNTFPDVTLNKLEGNKGCIGQEYIFQISNYEKNPPTTLYNWKFDDTNESILWTHEEVKENDGKISHTYNFESCNSAGDTDHFGMSIKPIVKVNGKTLYDNAIAIMDIVVSQATNIDLTLKVKNTIEEINTTHTGCINTTKFEFTNSSNYGLEGYFCEETDNHKWIVTKYEDEIEVGDAELGTDYFFESGSANSKEDISIGFLKTGTYKITFTLANACSSSEETTGTISIYEDENTTTYTPHDFCLADDETVSFTTTENPEIEALQKTGYIWSSTSVNYEFVEETNANSQNPKIKFKKAGKHIVHLQKESLCGTENYEYIVEVSEIPIVSINNLPDLTGDGHCGAYTFSPTANFTDNGRETFGIEDNVIDQYEWTFNNNGIITNSTNKIPGEITFDKIGKSSISLRAHNSKCGWSDIDKIEFEIYEIPTPVINRIDQACQEEEISYSAQPDGMKIYNWRFGSGNTKSAQNATNTFLIANTYTDRLTIVSNEGCTNFVEKPITILPKPAVDAGANLSICNSDISFKITDASAQNSSSIKWTSNGDGSFSNDINLLPTYTLGTEDQKKPIIELTLTAKGNGTCGEQTDTKTINITPIPAISFDKTTDKICQYSTYEIKGVSVENQSSVEWTASETGIFLNKNAIETSFTPSSDFSGTISLTLTAYGNGSCAETQKSFELEVIKYPTVDAKDDSRICEGEEVSLAATCSSSLVKWESSGDGVFSDKNALTGTYTPGIKDIEGGAVILELHALGDAPCEASDLKRVYISQKPTVNAGADASMCKTFTSYTIQAGSDKDMANASNYKNLLWESSGTGNLTNKTSLNATYEPSEKDLVDGSVELSITAEADGSCSEAVSDKMILTFTDTPDVKVSDDITACQASQIDLSATAKNHSSVLWTSSGEGVFADPTQLITSYQPDPTETGNYLLTLTAKSTGSCDDVSDELKITLIGKVEAKAGVDGEVCSNGTYNLSAGKTGASTYSSSELEWTSEGDGSFDNAKIINANYKPGVNDIINGSVKLSLTAQPEAPCSVEHSDSMILQITSAPTANAGENKAICQGEALNMEDGSTQNSSSLKWETSSADGFFENETSLNATYHPGKDDTGKYTLSLIVYGKGSCSFTTDEMELDITPAPTVSIEDKARICEDGNYTIQNTIIKNSLSYTWNTTGLGILTDTDDLVPTYQTAENETGDITISLTVEGNGRCGSKTASTTLSIISHPFIDAGDDAEVCSDKAYSMNVGPETGQVNAKSWSSIEYNSSGNGDFIDRDGLQATYVLSDNDKLKGEVDITITAHSISPCDEFAKDIMTLKITPAPLVKAGADDKICEGDSYELVNATQENTSELIWTSLNGGTFSDANILHTIYMPETGKTGNVTLQLTGKGKSSCSEKSDQMSLQIVPVPKVKAGDDASICYNKNYDLASTIASSFSTILWETSGSGTFSNNTELHPTYLPSTKDFENGKVTLTITVQGLTPCLLEAKDEIELQFIEAPFVFAGNDDEICEGNEKYNIKAKTTENPTGAEVKKVSSYLWETNGRGSLQNSNTITPTYIPANNETGVIQFTLKAVGFSNCENTEDTMELIIIPAPAADFSVGTSCIGSTVAFEDKSDGRIYSIEEWSWNFGDGNVSKEQNTNHEFSEIKDYSVTLSVTNNKGCSSSIEKTTSIHPLPEVKFSHDSYAAIYIPTDFKNESTNAVNYSWNFGDATTSFEIDPSHTYLTEKVFTVLLEAESADGCFNSHSSTIEVIGKPEAGFTKTPDGCGPLTVEFFNSSKGEYLSYLWDFGNGTKSTEANPDPIIYEQGVLSDTTYLVSLTIENKAGTSIFTDKVIVKPRPIPLFEILPSASGCSPVVRELFNYSEGLPDNYSFDFGDGETYEYTPKDIERPFEHTFITGDTKTIYPITLTASNECGDRTITKNMTVFPNSAVAVMKVNDAEGCAPFTVEFQNLSTGAGDYLESDWVFEDGEMAIRDYDGKTVYHTFEKAGVYQVQLSVHDTCATDFTTRKIIVNDAIDIDFKIKARKLCMFEEVQLSIPEDIRNQFTNITWDMGDGTLIEGSDIKHNFKKAGNYLIKLCAISKENSCEKTQTKELVIHQKPIADFSLSSNEGCEPFKVSFNNKSSFADYYQWDFNDSSKSSVKSPTHPFSEGNYSVSLIAESGEGCLDTLSVDLISRPKPIAQFEIDINESCIIPVNVKVNNTSPDKEFNGYVWDFDNGTIRTNKQAIEETFTCEGEYNIKLTAENQFHCTDTFTKQLNVYKAPVAKYKIISKTTCQDELIEFADVSTDSRYCYWSFSDGSISEGKNASHIFKDYGKYDLTLKVVGDGNCEDRLFAKEAILIYPKPNVEFTWENVNTPPDGIAIPEGQFPPNNGVVQFTNQTEILNIEWIKDNRFTYNWDFDDFDLSQEKDPLHKYKNNGTFQVKLTALSAYSCESIISEPVDVNLMSSLFVPNAFNPGNPDPQVALFLPKGIGLHSYNIEILDRWGKVVWLSNQIKDGRPAEGWDGTTKGKPLPQGIYIWKIRAVFKNGATWQGMKIDGKYHREGSLTLIK